MKTLFVHWKEAKTGSISQVELTINASLILELYTTPS